MEKITNLNSMKDGQLLKNNHITITNNKILPYCWKHVDRILHYYKIKIVKTNKFQSIPKEYFYIEEILIKNVMTYQDILKKKKIEHKRVFISIITFFIFKMKQVFMERI